MFQFYRLWCRMCAVAESRGEVNEDESGESQSLKTRQRFAVRKCVRKVERSSTSTRPPQPGTGAATQDQGSSGDERTAANDPRSCKLGFTVLMYRWKADGSGAEHKCSSRSVGGSVTPNQAAESSCRTNEGEDVRDEGVATRDEGACVCGVKPNLQNVKDGRKRSLDESEGPKGGWRWLTLCAGDPEWCW